MESKQRQDGFNKSEQEVKEIADFIASLELKHPDVIALIGNVYFAVNQLVNSFTIQQNDEITSNALLEAFFRQFKQSEEKEV